MTDEAPKPVPTQSEFVWLKLAVFCAAATAYVAAVFWMCRAIWNFIV